MTTIYTYSKQRGNCVYTRGYDEGKPFIERIRTFTPTLFVKSTSADGDWKDLRGNPLKRITFGDVNDAREFIEQYRMVDNFELHGQTDLTIQFISHWYRLDQCTYRPDWFNVVTLDIETAIENGRFPSPERADEEILLITAYTTRRGGEYRVFTSRAVGEETWRILSERGIERARVKLHRCENERAMLNDFVQWWSLDYPDAYTGWNTEKFDLPYLINRIRNLIGDDAVKKLSPFGYVDAKEVRVGDKVDVVYDVGGIADLDYLALMRKYTYGDRESWKLGDVAEDELGETKLEFDCAFAEAYRLYWDRFVAYNIIDVDIVRKLEQKQRLIELAYTIAYMAGINPDDVYSPIKTWDAYIYNVLKSQKIALPPRSNAKPTKQIVGGYVKTPTPGKYRWVVSFDFASLYPHLMMFLNWSPETFVGMRDGVWIDSLVKRSIDTSFAKAKRVALAGNGAVFTLDREGFIPRIIEHLYDLRKTTKKAMLQQQSELESMKQRGESAGTMLRIEQSIASLNAKQMAIKILMNSLYGASASPFFRFFDERMAEAITATGQVAIQTVANDINSYLNRALNTNGVDYVVAADTDSNYVVMDAIVRRKFGDDCRDEDKIRQYLERFATEIMQEVINRSTRALGEYLNSPKIDKLNMKLEKVASDGIFVARKRYALRVLSSEGVAYAKPKLSATGLELVRSSTPGAVKPMLERALYIALSGCEDELHQHIDECRAKFFAMPPSEVAFPRGVNGMQQYRGVNAIYTKGCPIHVRAALLFNHHVQRLGLTGRYRTIDDGAKIRFLYLKMPNPLHENVIGFEDRIPPEFGIDDYVDYAKMFEKTFLEPLNTVLEAIGWKSERRVSLEDMF